MHAFLVLVLLVVAHGSAHAKFGNPYPARNTAVDTALSNYPNKQILDLAIERQGGTPSKPGRAKPAVTHAPITTSDFKPGKGRPAVDAFLAKTKLPFISAQKLRPVIDETFVLVEGYVRKHNVASAIGFVIGTSLTISRNLDLGKDALNELIANINDKLAASASFRALEAADRQAMYDSLITTGAILIVLNTLGEHDEGLKADAMEMANELLHQLGES
jgi:hypothetical protein